MISRNRWKEALGGPVPAEGPEDDGGVAEEMLFERDLPPDHYIVHRLKMAVCEARQQAKMLRRRCRRSPKGTRAARHLET